MKRSYFTGLSVALFAFSALAGAVWAEEHAVVAAIRFDRPEDAARVITSGQSDNSIEEFDGRKVLHCNSLESAYEWNDILNIDLPGSGVYHATFDYRYVSRKRGDGNLFTSFSSSGVKWIYAGAALSEFPGEAGVTQHGAVTAVLLPTYDRYTFSIKLRMQADVLIDNIKVVKINDPRFLLNNRGLQAKSDLPAVKGAKEFTVKPPAPAVENEVFAHDFGVSADNGDNTEAFKRAIAYCRSNKSSKLTVKPGIYRFNGRGDILRFQSMNDFTLDAQGAEFIYFSDDQAIRTQFITLDNCQRVAVKNLTIDWDYERQPLVSHVKISAISPDRKSIDYTFVDYTDFRWRDVKFRHMALLDEKNLNPVFGADIDGDDNTRARKTWLNGNTVRFAYEHEIPPTVRVGQNWGMWHNSWGGTAIQVNNTAHANFENVNIFASQGFGFFIGGSDYIRISGCKITRRPDSKRIAGTNSDALDVINQREGNLLIENCEFGYSGDDFINMNNTTCIGLRMHSSANKLIVKTNWPSVFRTGNKLSIRNHDYSPTGFEPVVTSVEAGNKEAILTLDRNVPAGLPADAVVFNGANQTRNFIIRNNVFRHGYNRAILPNCTNGLIENNRFIGNCKSDLLMLTDLTIVINGEGTGLGNLLVRNNVFENSNVAGVSECAASIRVTMYGPGKSWYPVQQGIEIVDNKFINPNGSVLFTSAIQDLKFSGNTISTTAEGGYPFMARGKVLIGSHSDGVEISNNQWNAAQKSSPGIWIYPDNTGDVTAFGNNLTEK